MELIYSFIASEPQCCCYPECKEDLNALHFINYEIFPNYFLQTNLCDEHFKLFREHLKFTRIKLLELKEDD